MAPVTHSPPQAAVTHSKCLWPDVRRVSGSGLGLDFMVTFGVTVGNRPLGLGLLDFRVMVGGRV